MTDRELIELAAKAAAIDGKWSDYFGKNGMLMFHNPTTYRLGFNPLIDDGDALRLAVRLNIHIRLWSYASEAESDIGSTGLIHQGDFGDDLLAATRRAIVMAAAEIGKGMA